MKPAIHLTRALFLPMFTIPEDMTESPLSRDQ